VPQQSVPRNRYAQLAKQSRSGFPSEGKRDVGEQPLKPLSVRRA
jgi:hypothetical protein